jgi:hypothetical protein
LQLSRAFEAAVKERDFESQRYTKGVGGISSLGAGGMRPLQLHSLTPLQLDGAGIEEPAGAGIDKLESLLTRRCGEASRQHALLLTGEPDRNAFGSV